IATRWRFCGLPQSASCSENFVIPPDVFGQTLKDQELILRFLALLYDFESYSRPMRVFLNRFMEKNTNIDEMRSDEYSQRFNNTIQYVSETLERRAFRPERSLNTAVFDAVMVGLADRLRKSRIHDSNAFLAAYDKLLSDASFKDAYTRSTANEEKVKLRIRLAKDAFSAIS